MPIYKEHSLNLASCMKFHSGDRITIAMPLFPSPAQGLSSEHLTPIIFKSPLLH